MDRRAFLQTMSSAGLLTAMPEAALAAQSSVGPAVEVAQPTPLTAKYTVRFAVCGMSHDHIYGMIGAMQRGGGIMVAAYASEPDKLATFRKRFPDVKIVSSEQQILDDPSIQVVLSSRSPTSAQHSASRP